MYDQFTELYGFPLASELKTDWDRRILKSKSVRQKRHELVLHMKAMKTDFDTAVSK